MQAQLQIVSIVVSLGLFGLVFELVRRRRLLERYALLWLLTTITLFGLSLWKGLLDQISEAVGIGYGPSTLFAVALGFVTMLLLHFSVVISRLAEQNKVLAQQVGLLQRRVADLEDDAPTADAPTPAADRGHVS
ncbi:MAG: DUF2304 domain-containing protein [Patulibacter sp.]|nr:DUF2304 domain-containing protein [Patulibacter sp.]